MREVEWNIGGKPRVLGLANLLHHTCNLLVA